MVHVLGKLGEHPGGQTLSQLCRALELSKTTLFTLLKVLEGANYLLNDAGIYRLGGDGRICAEVSVGGPPERLIGRMVEFERAVRDAAEEISEILGYRREWPIQLSA